MALPIVSPLLLNSSQNGTTSLRAVGMLDLLECDTRPTFILDTTTPNFSTDDGTLPAYWNPAMVTTDSGRLFDDLVGKASTSGTKIEKPNVFLQFKSWVLDQGSTNSPFICRNFSWTKVLVARRWNVVSGISIDASVPSESRKPEGAILRKETSGANVQTFDWTDVTPPAKMSSHVAFARSIDWSSTPLGPMSSWSSQLRTIANIVIQDPRPAVVFYGPDLIMVYNEAEIELLGGFHPCMGVSARIALASVWSDHFEPIITRNLAGETVEKTNTAIHMVRNGFMEETYFSLKFIPLFDSNGATVGHYEPLVETVS